MAKRQWWEQRLELVGAAIFPLQPPLPLAQFDRLRKSGISVDELPAPIDYDWRARLYHPDWGAAEIAHSSASEPPSRLVLAFSGLTGEELDRASEGRSVLYLRMDPKSGNVLRDRKLLLRHLNALLGDAGVAALDETAQRAWTPGALADELAHDADLDVESIYAIHAVTESGGGPAYWIHTHGLGEIGFFDVDILEPSADVATHWGADALRALAFAILEGRAKIGGGAFELAQPGGTIELVSIDEFLVGNTGEAARRLAQDADEFHRRRRAVICEPRQSLGPKPSRFFSSPVPDELILGMSTSATDLMARRARDTYEYFRRLHAEFGDFDFPTLVKLGIVVDGGTASDREHMWFEVHDLKSDVIDGTLTNEPYYIARLHVGDRGTYPVELMSDWVILTPLGNISPRDTAAARAVRANAEELRRTHPRQTP